MTAHQDSRVEAALTAGAAKVVDALVAAVGDDVLGIEVGPALHALRGDLVAVVRGPLLELLAAVGVDTSAHVHAPRAEVHVHRDPPHDTEARPREPLSFE